MLPYSLNWKSSKDKNIVKYVVQKLNIYQFIIAMRFHAAEC